MLASVLKGHPCVAGSISTVLTRNESSVETQGQELPPRPECKVVTVSLSGLFKILRRLPIVVFAELFLVGHGFAGAQKLANVSQCFALNGEWLSEVSAHWSCRSETLASQIWSKILSTNGIVGFRDNFSDQDPALSQKLPRPGGSRIDGEIETDVTDQNIRYSTRVHREGARRV